MTAKVPEGARAFHYTVEVVTDTAEHADIVMRERVFFDEQYADEDGVEFDYSIDLKGQES